MISQKRTSLLFPSLILLLICPVSLGADVPLWCGTTDLSDKTHIPDLVAERTIIDRAVKGEYEFTLGADIIVYKDTLVAQWGNSRLKENDEGSVVRGRRSSDDGRTWTAPEVIAPGYEGAPRHCHGVLHAVDGQLWCFVAQFGFGSNKGRYNGLRSEAFQWIEPENKWISRGVFGEIGFWPLGKPVRMDNGKWIMPGAVVEGKGAQAAVAISDGRDWTQWRIILIDHPEGVDYNKGSGEAWGETAVIIQGRRVLAIVRNPRGKAPLKPNALYATSEDYGETWPRLRESNLPMSTAKPAAGTLADGRHYLIATYPDGGRNTRDTMYIALTKPGALSFDEIYKFIDGPSTPPGAKKRSQWAYPAACEHKRKLYVVYSKTKEDTGMSIIDLARIPLR